LRKEYSFDPVHFLFLVSAQPKKRAAIAGGAP
jgi:hypothetical protein